MGIAGLHQVLKLYLLPVSLSKYSGQRVACDAYAWLHRGACQTAGQLGPDATPGLPPCVTFCLTMLALLRGHGIIPLVVPVPEKGQLHLIAISTRPSVRSEGECCRWCLTVPACQLNKGHRLHAEPRRPWLVSR